MDLADDIQFDPSSISLFANVAIDSQQVTSNDEATRDSFATEAMRPISSLSAAQAEDSAPIKGHKSTAGMSYSKYMKGKSVEVAKRRDLIERIERVKSAHGLLFNIPQFKQPTMNQLSVFLRRLRKAPEIKTFISTEMLDKVFAKEDAQKAQTQIQALLKQNETTMTTSSKKEVESRQMIADGSYSDSEVTDEDETDYEEDFLLGSKNALSAELYDLLEQRAQIISVDYQAEEMQNEIERKLSFARTLYETIPHDNSSEQATQMTDSDSEQNLMACARCRPFQRISQRELIPHVFCSRRHNPALRPIISNKKCGTKEYSFADESIHPKLSLPSFIPLDLQLLKYLHLSGLIANDVEIRRYKMAQMISSVKATKNTHKFYNLEAGSKGQGNSDRLGSPEAYKGIKISLPFRKTLKREKRDNEADSDTDDAEFAFLKKRRRLNTDYSTKNNSSNSSKIETRRPSQPEYGSSVFDYDSQLMDVGSLPSIQKVEEITIPSFRKKSGLLKDDRDSSVDCCIHCKSDANPWDEIRRQHAELEAQENASRFRQPTNSLKRATNEALGELIRKNGQ